MWPGLRESFSKLIGSSLLYDTSIHILSLEAFDHDDLYKLRMNMKKTHFWCFDNCLILNMNI